MTQECSKTFEPLPKTRTEELALHGITCIPIDNFYYREFHYTRLDDALAQAIRDKVRLGLMPAA